MPTLILIGHLEMVPAGTVQGSKKPWLGYTLSVGWSLGTGETLLKPPYTGSDDPLLPWTWTRKIDRFQLFADELGVETTC